MFRVEESGEALGARIEGLDVSRALDGSTFSALENTFHRYGVVTIGDQRLTDEELIDFSRRFGELEINVATSFHHPRYPELTILSNIKKDGKNIGSADAGQGWHTDMSYNAVPARASILYAIQVPHDGNRPLGDTLFANMYVAYGALPDDVRGRVDHLAAEHDFSKFYNYMIEEKRSERPPLTEGQRQRKPPAVHPMVVRHPFTGRKCLYANPGYTTRILDVPEIESRELLEFLFKFQTEPRFTYRHKWRVGDLLIWDNVATIHMATGGYGPHQHRRMHRAQVLGNSTWFAAFKGMDRPAYAS